VRMRRYSPRRDVQRHVGLDELLDATDGEPDQPDQPRPIGWVGLVRRAVFITIASALSALVLSQGVLPIVRLSVPYSLLFGVAAGLLVLRAVVGSVAEPDEPDAGSLVGLVGGPVRESIPHRFDDGLYRTVRRWEMRLDWAASERLRFQRLMPGLLGELVDERLRQHHGITRASDPARARHICGAHLWSFLHDDLTAVPTPKQLVSLVDLMEKI
jgi:hypothetical protein